MSRAERQYGPKAGMTCLGAGLLALLMSGPAWADEALSQAADIGAYAAVAEMDGIELRDSQNRIISRSAVAKSLRSGGSQVAREAATLSELKGLKNFLSHLDRAGLGKDALGEAHPIAGTGHKAFAMAPPRAPKARIIAAAPPAPAHERRSPFHPDALQFSLTPGRVSVQVLLL